MIVSYDKTIKIWELATDDCIKTLLGHSDYVFCIANNRIASYCIWDVESGDCVKILNGKTNEILSILTHSNERILSGSNNECLRTFKVHLSKLLQTKFLVEILSNERIRSCSPKDTKIWNIQTIIA